MHNNLLKPWFEIWVLASVSAIGFWYQKWKHRVFLYISHIGVRPKYRIDIGRYSDLD